MDNISDAFLETNLPLLMMIEAAKAGNERETEDCAKLFMDHAAKLEEVGGYVCVNNRLLCINSYVKIE